jgi:hypothetical protein
MHPIISYTLAILMGLIIGSAVNMGIILAGAELIPVPEGVNPFDATNWDLKYFVSPFLAHSLGTVAGACTAALIAPANKKTFALIIGGWFLIGGIVMVTWFIKSPAWYTCLDLTVAYIPMSILGWSLTK